MFWNTPLWHVYLLTFFGPSPFFWDPAHLFFRPPPAVLVCPSCCPVSVSPSARTHHSNLFRCRSRNLFETYSFRKAFPLNLKDDMAILFLQALKHHDRLWFMSSCRESVWLWWHLLLLCPSHWHLPFSPFCRWCVNLYLCIFICVCVFVYYAPAIVSNWGCSVSYGDFPGTFGNGLTVVVIHR